MTKRYSINELSQYAGVSVRTLHYYDQIDLLKPAYRNAHGRRFYSEKDIFHLQQILTLKFVGMSLGQIKQFVKDSETDFIKVLKLQTTMLEEEMARTQKAVNLIRYLLCEYRDRSHVDWDIVAKIMNVIKKNTHDKTWYQTYLAEAEVKKLNQYRKKRSKVWLQLMLETKELLNKDPTGKFAKRMVQKWLKVTKQSYGDDPPLHYKLAEAFKSGMIADFPFDKDVINYLSKGMDAPIK